MQQSFLHIISTMTIAVLAGGIGTAGLFQTDLNRYDRPLWDGQYQRRVEGGFTENLPFRSTAIHIWNAFGYGVLGQTSNEVISGQEGWLFTAEEFRPPEKHDFEAELLSALEVLALYDIRLIPVIVPDKARIYADMLDHPRPADLEARYSRLQSLLQRHELPAPDLNQKLMAGRATAETYLKTDTHWSPQGARIAAVAVAQALNVTSDGGFRTTVSEPVPFNGDLLAFIETGPFRSFTGPLPEQIRPYTTFSTAGADTLFGPSDAPIALIGTSFSARAEFNFAGFLSQETGLGLISYATEGEGPFLPMQRFLRALPELDSLPEIAIWEIPERYIYTEDMK